MFLMGNFGEMAAISITAKEVVNIDAFSGEYHLADIRPLSDGKNIVVSRRGGKIDEWNLETKSYKERVFQEHCGILCLEALENLYFVYGIVDLTLNMTSVFLRTGLDIKNFWQRAPGKNVYFGTTMQIVLISPGVIAFRSGSSSVSVWDWMKQKLAFVETGEKKEITFRVLVPPGIIIEKCCNNAFSLYDIQKNKYIYTSLDSVGTVGLYLFGKEINEGLLTPFKKLLWWSHGESSIYVLDTKNKGAKLQSLNKHTDKLRGLMEISLNNTKHLFSGDKSGKFCLWADDDLNDISLVNSLIIPGGIRSFFIKTDEKSGIFRLFVTTEDDHIKIYDCCFN
jgi:WD40 repeat protein